MTDTRINYELDGQTFQLFVPEGFEGRPETALDILQRAKAILVREGVWTTGNWFINRHPDLDPQDAFCNSWSACMDGALVIAAIGARRHKYEYADGSAYNNWESAHRMHAAVNNPLLSEARKLVLEAGKVVFDHAYARHVESHQRVWDKMDDMQRGWHGNDFDGFVNKDLSIPSFNDGACTTRDRAIQWLDKAIEMAESKED